MDKKQRTSERRMKLVDTTRGNVMRNLREKEDHHLELDHCGKKEKLKIEKLPKSATFASNEFMHGRVQACKRVPVMSFLR